MFNSVVAVIPAAGLGTRMGGATPKQYLTLEGKPLLIYSLQVIHNLESIQEIILSVPESDLAYCRKEIIQPFGLEKVKKIVPGGTRRQDSVRNGLNAISSSPDGVLIHDGVRPFIDQICINQAIDRAGETGAAVVAIPIHDTVKRVDRNGIIQETLKREELWQIQTPQVFRLDWLIEAHRQAQQHDWDVTDDASLIERMGHAVSVVEGSCFNIKVTTPNDLRFGEAILRLRKSVT